MNVLSIAASDIPEYLASTFRELDGDGVLSHPMVTVDFDSCHEFTIEEVEVYSRALERRLPLMVGLLRGELNPRYRSLLRALTMTLTPRESHSRELVRVADIQSALAELKEVIERAPNAAVTFGSLLRQTTLLPIWEALVSESATYSMLLASAEFAAWRARTHLPPAPNFTGDTVRITRRADELAVVLHRPERRNAYSREMRDSLIEALDLALADPSLRRVHVSGDGQSFCSGGDLGEFGSTANVVTAHQVRMSQNAGWRLWSLGERAVVHVHGACVGAGVELAAFAHRVESSPDATFHLPEVSMGLIPGAGGSVSLPHRIGRWRTAWLGLTGSVIDAEQAYRWGLVDSVRECVVEG